MFELPEISRFLSRRVALYEFSRGGVSLRYTSAAQEITVGGQVFLPARGITHGAIRESGGSVSKNQVTITAPYLLDATAPEFPVTQELGNWWRPFPPSQRVLVRIMSMHLGDPDAEVVTQWLGRVVGPSYSKSTVKLTCDPSYRSGRMSGSIPRMQRGCGVALYSQGLGMCNLNPQPLPVQGTVTAIDGDDVTLQFAQPPARPLDVRWPVEWTDADDEPRTAQMVSIAGNVLTLDDTAHLAVGDVLTVYTEPLWTSATLTGVDGLALTAPEFAASAKPLAGGLIEWTRPGGLVETRSIMAHQDDTVRVQYGAPDLQPGLEVRAYFGCAHNLDACRSHGNEVNYPGWVHLPSEDPMARSQAW